MSTREFIIGMLVGYAVGVTAGLFLAPGEGVQTRRRISDAAYSTRNKVGHLAMGIQEKAHLATKAIKQAI